MGAKRWVGGVFEDGPNRLRDGVEGVSLLDHGISFPYIAI